MQVPKKLPITVYDPATGEILAVTSIAPGKEAGIEAKGLAWHPGHVRGEGLRFDLDTMQPVPMEETAPTIEDNRLGDLPPGTVVVVQGRKLVVDNGTLDIEAEFDASERITVMAPGRKPTEVVAPCKPGKPARRVAGAHQHKLAQDYGTSRRAEYPSVEDQLDAFWKGGDEAEAMRERVLAVKDKFPKPKD